MEILTFGRIKTVILHIQYHGGWCPGDIRNQDINSHGIDLDILEYSGFSTEKVNLICCSISRIPLSILIYGIWSLKWLTIIQYCFVQWLVAMSWSIDNQKKTIFRIACQILKSASYHHNIQSYFVSMVIIKCGFCVCAGLNMIDMWKNVEHMSDNAYNFPPCEYSCLTILFFP